MILVDTSVWAAYFNGEEIAEVWLLDEILSREREEIAILPIILTEVLQGFRSDAGFRRAGNLLKRLVVLEPSLDTHLRAAALFRRLRGKGVTVRGAVDCLIAQTCTDMGLRLLTLDKDFARIAQHVSLVLIRP